MRQPTRKPIRIGTDYLPEVLHCELSREQQGELLQWILEYLFRGKEPQNPEPDAKRLDLCPLGPGL